MKIKRKDLQRLIESYLNEEEAGSGGLSAAGKGPGGGGEVDAMPDVYQGENPFNKRSPGKAEKKRKRAAGNQTGPIAEIQRLLNELKAAGFIDGDYQGRKLNDDGKWGDRTRSAASKALKKLIDEKHIAKIRDSGVNKNLTQVYGNKGERFYQEVTSKNLNLEKRGGEGKWEVVIKKLTPGLPDSNSSVEEKLEYLLEVVVSYLKDTKTTGSAEGGEAKEYFYGKQSNIAIRVTKKANKIIKLEQFKDDAYIDFTDKAGDLGFYYEHYIIKANYKKVTKSEELGKFQPKADKVLAESRGTLYRRRYSRY